MEEKLEEGREESKEELIKNIGILNLKDVKEEDIERMKKIKNIGVILAPKELIGKISAKIVDNVGVIVPYIEGMRLYIGKTSINADMLRSLDEPIDILQAGQLVVEKDVTPELILQKIKSFRNYGKTSVPTKQTLGALMAKCIENMGKIEVEEEET
ncbi:MAG: hypothetical protein QXO92_01840 [Candidatus Bathyarchaeia archaeon]